MVHNSIKLNNGGNIGQYRAKIVKIWGQIMKNR